MSAPSMIDMMTPAADLDADALAASIRPDTARRIERLDVFGSLDSTSRYLLETRPPAHGRMHVAVADYQHAGRGRRGRSWTAPPGGGLCLSVGISIRREPGDLLALPLAAGVAARRGISAACGVAVALKWPNDVAWRDRKLGGILVERGSAGATLAHVVIGIGINVSIPRAMLPVLSDWPAGAVDLAEATEGRPPPRVALAGALVDELAALSVAFERDGFAPYRDEFAAADALLGRTVLVDGEGAATSGIARGVDEHGALIVELPDGSRRRVLAGDVSIRAARRVEVRE